MYIKSFVFNPIQENTYLLYDDTKSCMVIDAGCFFPNEQAALIAFIEENKLTLKRVINTHSHFDHVFGNAFLFKKYALKPEAHEGDAFFIPNMIEHAKSFGFHTGVETQEIGRFINEGDLIEFGNTTLVAIHVPGHSPGSLCFYCAEDKVLFSGDVLFEGSIGRTDLPGGDFGTLLDGITKKILILPDDTVVYPGHGDLTTIAREKQNNPYL